MKTNYIKWSFWMLLFVFFGCTQKRTNDNLIHISNDSLPAYFDLANDFNLPRQKRLEYIYKANNIVIHQDNDSLNRINLFKVANRYYNVGDWKEYSKTVNLVLNNSKRVGDTISLAKAYGYLGDYYLQKSISDSAFLYYYKAEKMYAKLNDKYQLAKTLINKAELLFRVGDLIGSEKEVFKVLRIIKNKKNTKEIFYDAYNLLGLVYNGLDEYENAILYHNKALESIESNQIIGEGQTKAISYLNLGLVYVKLKNFESAKKYFQKGIQQKNIEDKDPRFYALLLDYFAYAKFKLGEKEGLPDLFYQSLKIDDSLKLSSNLLLNKLHLSEYFYSVNDKNRSFKYAKEALALARDNKVPRDILLSLKQIAVVDFQNTATYTEEYIRINEELQKAERKMGDKFTRIEYETDQIKDENSNLTEKNRKLVYVFSFVAILGLFFYIIKSQKAKNRELLYKQEQQLANEEIYNLMISQQNTIETNRVQEKKRVAQELHDGVLGRMFGVRMNLDGLNRFNDEMAIEQRNAYLSELKNIEQDIREISHDLNREKSELINNFVAIVDNLFEEQRKTFSSKLVSNIDVNIKWEIIPNAVKINLYRIIQESLQNINKYAKADLIKVELKKLENEILLVIIDDGVGFNSNLKKKGIGLQNMQARAIECKGTFNIQSKIGEGATVSVTVPIEQQQIPT